MRYCTLSKKIIAHIFHTCVYMYYSLLQEKLNDFILLCILEICDCISYPNLFKHDLFELCFVFRFSARVKYTMFSPLLIYTTKRDYITFVLHDY